MKIIEKNTELGNVETREQIFKQFWLCLYSNMIMNCMREYRKLLFRFMMFFLVNQTKRLQDKVFNLISSTPKDHEYGDTVILNSLVEFDKMSLATYSKCDEQYANKYL